MNRILMFGWEFPPFKSGGLGKACRDLCKGLHRLGNEITFVMPISPEEAQSTDVAQVIGARRSDVPSSVPSIDIMGITSPIQPYTTPEEYLERVESGSTGSGDVRTPDVRSGSFYGQDLMLEVERYTRVAGQIAAEESFDVIHAHDWMTYRAGLIAREISGKPLVAHIHATEYDRTAGNPTPQIADLEREGLSKADLVIANSNWTKQNVIDAYQIPEEKIRVVHWGIEMDEVPETSRTTTLSRNHNLVLFLGRITVQKGPDYFIEAAARVLEHEPDTRFIVAGEGDMLPSIMNRAAEMGIREQVIFTGWLEGDEVNRVFQASDLFVMPSVSEPFGLVALESLKNGTPAILSKQSGVSEVLHHCLKVDFWDVNQLTNKIVGALRYPAIRRSMKEFGTLEVNQLNLEDPARKTVNCYRDALSGRSSS